MPILLLSLNISLVLLASLLLLAQLRVRDRVAFLVGMFVAGYADIVLILQLAGLFSILSPGPVLLLQLLFTTAMALAWIFNEKPNLFGPFTGVALNQWVSWHIIKPNIMQAIKSPWTLAIIVAVPFVYLQHIQVILSNPPSTGDSLTYHLARVGFWMQYETFYPWPTPNLRQTTFPMNAELGLLWSILWWGNDQLTGFVQWMAVPATMLSLYGLARLLGFSRMQGTLVALLWATLPQVLYQSKSTQNDLVVSCFWRAAVYLFFQVCARKRHLTWQYPVSALGLQSGPKAPA